MTDQAEPGTTAMENTKITSTDDLTVGLVMAGVANTDAEQEDEAEPQGESENDADDEAETTDDGGAGEEEDETDDDGGDEDGEDNDDPLPFLNDALARYANATTDESKTQIASGIQKRFSETKSALDAAQPHADNWLGLANALEESPERAKAVLQKLAENVAAHHKADIAMFGFDAGATGDAAGGETPASRSGALAFSDDELDTMVDDMDLASGEVSVLKAMNERMRQADSLIASLEARLSVGAPGNPATKQGEGKTDTGTTTSQFSQVSKGLRASRAGFVLTKEQYEEAVNARPDLKPADAVQIVHADAIAGHMAAQASKHRPKDSRMPSGSNQTGRGPSGAKVRSVDDITVDSLLRSAG